MSASLTDVPTDFGSIVGGGVRWSVGQVARSRGEEGEEGEGKWRAAG